MRDDFQLGRPKNDVVLLGDHLLDWPEHAYDFLVLGSRASGLKAARLEKLVGWVERSATHHRRNQQIIPQSRRLKRPCSRPGPARKPRAAHSHEMLSAARNMGSRTPSLPVPIAFPGHPC